MGQLIDSPERLISVGRQRGLTLIELMVSLALSVIVLSGLTYVYVGSRGAYRSNEAIARVQETGRFALEWLTRDIRQAGYLGCLSRGLVPDIYADPPPTNFTGPATALFGYENGAAWTNPTTIARVAGTDVIVMSGLTGVQANIMDSDVVNANIKIDQNCMGLKKDDIVMATDCKRAALIKITNNPTNTCPASAGPNVTIVHANSGNNGPAFTDPLCNGQPFRICPPYTRGDRAILVKFDQYGYFIGTNPVGRPALYRWSLSRGAEEVVENVEDMDLLFGEDTDNDGAANVYRRADQVANWANVISVRVSLVAVSAETGAVVIPNQTYFLRDSNNDGVPDAASKNDRRLRQVFTTTVAVRNRLP
jgi:type IV pilus assembly protein PilW